MTGLPKEFCFLFCNNILATGLLIAIVNNQNFIL